MAIRQLNGLKQGRGNSCLDAGVDPSVIIG